MLSLSEISVMHRNVNCGTWLIVLSSKNLGTLLDNNAFRISNLNPVKLRCDICSPHRCVCGRFEHKQGGYELSFKQSADGKRPSLVTLESQLLIQAQLPN